MMVCYLVLISIVNIASGKHALYGAHLVLWSLAGSMQGTIFGLVAQYIVGTPLMPVYLRCLGAKVGKNVFWDASPPRETKALRIGDGAIIEAGAMILPHTVDHGEMTHGTISIGDHAIVSSGVNMQPGSHLGVGASLDCLSLAMKNERFPDHTAWGGTPAMRVSEDVFAVRRAWAADTEDHPRASSGPSFISDNPVFRSKTSPKTSSESLLGESLL